MLSPRFTAFRRIALITGVLFLGSAQAHHVWIEQDQAGSGNATLYFGEYGGNLREASPGLLDKFIAPVARKVGARGAQPLTAQKMPGGFALGARAGRGEAIVAEEPAYPAYDIKEGDKTLRGIYVPAARLAPGWDTRQEPLLTLDLVPTGNSSAEGVEVQAFYRGQALPKAKVEVVTAAGWSQTHHSDADGKLKVQMPWRGTYVLELSHADKAGGQRGADKWDRASYVTSLTLMQDQGVAPLPAPPAAIPNAMK